MQDFKSELHNLLSNTGWLVVDQRAGENWWVQEVWRFQSVGKGWGKEIDISFQFRSPENVWETKYSEAVVRQGVVEIIATTGNAGEFVALVGGGRHVFSKELSSFVNRINKFREENY